MKFAPHLLIAAACLLVAPSCTFEPGSPWGWIDSELQIGPISDSGDVVLETQSIHVDAMQLRSPAGSTGGVDDFDPANPPPGFTLCHSGHCHTEDGRIVTYEEIEAGMGLDPDEPVNVDTAELDTAEDLDGTIALDALFRIVDETSITDAAVIIDHLSLVGAFDYQGDTYDLEIELSMATRPISGGVYYEVGRSFPEVQTMELVIGWPDDLFDDLPALEQAAQDSTDGSIVIHGTRNRQIADELSSRLAEGTQLEWVE